MLNIRLLVALACFGFNALGIFAHCCSSVSADEPDTVWGLQAGDRFVVNVFLVKQTEVTIEKEEPSTSDTRDRFEIEYRVAEVLKSGDLVVSARLKRARREAGSTAPDSIKSSAPSARSLEELRVRFQVDSVGHVTGIDAGDRDAILIALSNLDPLAWQIIRDSCPDDVIIGWLSRPFWTVPDSTPLTDQPSDDAATEAIRIADRQDAISLGPYGILKTTIELRPETGPDGETAVIISGTGRFVQLVIPESVDVPGPVSLKDISAELDEFTGKVRLSKGGDEKPSRPQLARAMTFQSMETTTRLHGQGTLHLPAPAEPRQISFRQTQIQLWVVTEQSFGHPEMLFGVPVPADPQ